MSTDTTSLDAEVSQIKARHAAATRARARAEQQEIAARATADAARAQLREQFGVDTVAEANALLAQLDTRQQELITALRTALDEAGA